MPLMRQEDYPPEEPVPAFAQPTPAAGHQLGTICQKEKAARGP
jgi:hypothetical protein